MPVLLALFVRGLLFPTCENVKMHIRNLVIIQVFVALSILIEVLVGAEIIDINPILYKLGLSLTYSFGTDFSSLLFNLIFGIGVIVLYFYIDSKMTEEKKEKLKIFLYRGTFSNQKFPWTFYLLIKIGSLVVVISKLLFFASKKYNILHFANIVELMYFCFILFFSREFIDHFFLRKNEG